ncbi:hypothetical protein SFRURICE_007498, partial [Spodoptera frugiperda]
SLTANRKLLKANPSLTSVTSDHHGVQCENPKQQELGRKPARYDHLIWFYDPPFLGNFTLCSLNKQ